jgi:broad specificity phosphatase PhoE
MGEIYLVRHGQASFGAANYDALSSVGHEQARHLGDYFRQRGLEFDRVAIGTMTRHRETLDGTGVLGNGASTLAPEILPGLNEYDFHALIHCHVAQFPTDPPVDLKDPRAFYRQLRLALGAWADGSLQPGETCESWAVFEARIRQSLRALTAKADAKRILVVSSGGAISMLIREVLGLRVEQMIEMNLQTLNTSITRLMFKGDRVRLQSWNGLPHLERPEAQHLLSYT